MIRFFLPIALFIVSIAPNFSVADHHEKKASENPRIDSLIKGYNWLRGQVFNNIDGLTDNQINFIAKIGDNQYNNSIAMLAHHLISSEKWICGNLTDKTIEIETVEDPFAVKDAKVEDVKTALKDSFDKISAVLKTMTDDELMEDGMKMRENQMTKAETVQLILIHAATHNGQITVLKRLQGIQ